MRQAIEHLITEHHKTKIGFVSGRRENADAKERLDTYCQVLMDHNIPVEEDRIVYGNFSEFTEDIVNNLLDANRIWKRSSSQTIRWQSAVTTPSKQGDWKLARIFL